MVERVGGGKRLETKIGRAVQIVNTFTLHEQIGFSSVYAKYGKILERGEVREGRGKKESINPILK